MIPTAFKVLGTGGKKLIGIRAIGNSYINTGIIPSKTYTIQSDFHYPAAGNVIFGCFQNGEGNACRLSRSSLTSFIFAYYYFGTQSVIVTNANDFEISMNSQNITINGATRAVTITDENITIPLYIFCENRTGSPSFYVDDDTYIKKWHYYDSENNIFMQLEPQIVNGKARLVDVLTGNIPQHIGEFEPVYE